MMDNLLALFTPFAVQVGLTCMVAQIVLYTLFATEFFGLWKTGGPWSKMPGFTAHQVVTIPVLVYLSLQGLREFGHGDVVTAVDRLTGPRHGHLSEFVLGMMFFWDIPTGLSTPALRDIPMVFHHFGMCVTAAVTMGVLSHGQPICGFYGPFFFGLIELSSLPLIFVDIFHPKHKAWHAYLTSNERSPWIMHLNDVSRLVFAASFLVLRTICFPYVTVVYVLVDVWKVTALPLEQRNDVPNLPLFIIAAFNVLFSCLQLYWGTYVVK
jgi:TLC domain